ncbi:hypothetical protein M758_UG073900 [Ceratodon purpureus]|nr:hypothetical protein M758_UG073900 [Ceratodon purpureus]
MRASTSSGLGFGISPGNIDKNLDGTPEHLALFLLTPPLPEMHVPSTTDAPTSKVHAGQSMLRALDLVGKVGRRRNQGVGRDLSSNFGEAASVGHKAFSGSTSATESIPAASTPPNGLKRNVSKSVPVGAEGGKEFASPNDRWNFMRRQRAQHLRNLRNRVDADGKTRVTTDEEGNPVDMISVLNRAIRDTTARVLDVTVQEFSQHPALAFELISHDVHSQFSFNPPLRNGYIRNYLQESLSWCRY